MSPSVRFKRFFWFLLSIFLGAGMGVFYGWVVNPVRYVDTTPDQLRADYQADYVLMVAEIYQLEKDPALAGRQLALLGDPQPVRTVQKAILTASQLGYSQADMELLGRLSSALETWYAEGGP